MLDLEIVTQAWLSSYRNIIPFMIYCELNFRCIYTTKYWDPRTNKVQFTA